MARKDLMMAHQMGKKKVLFICTHNSARSQMAEGFLRALYGNDYEAFSAGTEPTAVHSLAVEVMREVGIDISSHRAKDVAEFTGGEMDYVVTVCDKAKETCPFFPYGKMFLHQSFPDPSAFEGDEKSKLAYFRHIRDVVRDWIEKHFGIRGAKDA